MLGDDGESQAILIGIDLVVESTPQEICIQICHLEQMQMN